jgi:eukaryotic-like serine/threonine-protein kinase
MGHGTLPRFAHFPLPICHSGFVFHHPAKVPMIGRTVSHYHVLGQLGSGGMGVVYHAQDLRLGRRVALKFLPQDLLLDPDARERFRREGRLASALSHPGICTVHDVDEYEGRPFIVMELVEGSSLTSHLQAGPFPVERAVDLAIEILEALRSAHNRGIIHRDVKPANIFVTPNGHAKVLDFGLARMATLEANATVTAAGSGPAPSTPTASLFDDTLTTPGVQVGTVAYMSPEQARGERLDTRSDLFALAAVLYELVTGQRAFTGSSLAVVCDQILNRQPPSPRLVNPVIPASLERIILRGLEKRREDRYPHADEMIADLRAVAVDYAGASPEPAGEIAPSRRSTPRRYAATITTATLIVIGGLAFAWPAGRRARSEPPLTDRDSILIANFVNTTGESVFDDTLSQALSVHISQSPFLDVVPERRLRETLRLMARPENTPISGAVARQACLRASAKAVLEPTVARVGRLYVVTLDARECASGRSIAAADASVERKEEVLHALGTVTSVVREKLGETPLAQFDVPIEQATTPSLEALQAYSLGRAQRAKGRELESIPLFKRALEIDPDFAAAHTQLSTVYGSLGESAPSEEHARAAYARKDRVSERERFLITYQFHDRVTGDQLEAARTLSLWKQTYPRDFVPANALSLVFNRLGFFERAVEEGKEALLRQPDHPFPLSNLAYAYRGLGRYDEARKAAQRAVDLKVETAPTRRLLYTLDLYENHPEAAEDHIRWAKDRPREFDLLSARAQWLAWQGRLREARGDYEQVIELAERRDFPEVAAGYRAHLALTEALYGNLGAARAAAEASLSGGRDSSATAAALPRFRAAAALALAGAESRAQEIARELSRRYPHSTLANFVALPVVDAAAALRRGRPADAVDGLRKGAEYDAGTIAALVPIYLRGLAYLGVHDGAQADASFSQILDHRGTDPFSPVCALAELGRARALSMIGKTDEARSAYERFFEAWKAADADLPILQAARREATRSARAVTNLTTNRN